MAEFHYDPKHDILDIELDRVSHNSVPVGGLVIDLTEDGELAGLEILNASENISNLTNTTVSQMKKVLENIKEVKVDSRTDRGMLVIDVHFAANIGEKVVETNMPLNVEAPA